MFSLSHHGGGVLPIMKQQDIGVYVEVKGVLLFYDHVALFKL